MNLMNTTEEVLERVIFFDDPLVGKIVFFFKNNKIETGSHLPIENRSIDSRFTGYKFKLNPGESKVLYFSRSSTHYLSTKIFISDIESFLRFEGLKENDFRFYIGAVVSLILYNFLLAIFFKNRKYYGYCFFIALILVTILSSYGYYDSVEFFGKSISEYSMVVVGISIITTLFFSIYFIDFKKYVPSAKGIGRILVAISLFVIIISVSPYYSEVVTLVGNIRLYELYF